MSPQVQLSNLQCQWLHVFVWATRFFSGIDSNALLLKKHWNTRVRRSHAVAQRGGVRQNAFGPPHKRSPASEDPAALSARVDAKTWATAGLVDHWGGSARGYLLGKPCRFSHDSRCCSTPSNRWGEICNCPFEPAKSTRALVLHYGTGDRAYGPRRKKRLREVTGCGSLLSIPTDPIIPLSRVTVTRRDHSIVAALDPALLFIGHGDRPSLSLACWHHGASDSWPAWHVPHWLCCGATLLGIASC